MARKLSPNERKFVDEAKDVMAEGAELCDKYLNGGNFKLDKTPKTPEEGVKEVKGYNAEIDKRVRTKNRPDLVWFDYTINNYIKSIENLSKELGGFQTHLEQVKQLAKINGIELPNSFENAFNEMKILDEQVIQFREDLKSRLSSRRPAVGEDVKEFHSINRKWDSVRGKMPFLGHMFSFIWASDSLYSIHVQGMIDDLKIVIMDLYQDDKERATVLTRLKDWI
jgi:hypothetical protein